METVIIILVFLLICIFDLLPIIKQKNKKEITVYIISISIGFVILILVSIGIELPEPSQLIQSTIQSLFNLK